jgi:hypothetical protein
MTKPAPLENPRPTKQALNFGVVCSRLHGGRRAVSFKLAIIGKSDGTVLLFKNS